MYYMLQLCSFHEHQEVTTSSLQVLKRPLHFYLIYTKKGNNDESKFTVLFVEYMYYILQRCSFHEHQEVN